MPNRLPVPTGHQVLRLKEQLGYPVFRAPYDMNLVGLRHPALEAQGFNDLVGFVFYDEDRRLHSELWPATTLPSRDFLQRPLAWLPGTAILLEGHYTGAYQLGSHMGYSALQQVQPIDYVRDDNHDGVPDIAALVRAGQVRRGEVIAANVHRASDIFVEERVGPWSAACQVVQAIWHWAALLTLAELQPRHGHGESFSYSLMPWADALEA